MFGGHSLLRHFLSHGCPMTPKASFLVRAALQIGTATAACPDPKMLGVVRKGDFTGKELGYNYTQQYGDLMGSNGHELDM